MSNEPRHHSFTVRPVTWQSVKHELMMLRTLVFIQEQNVSEEDEWDSEDETAIHFLACNSGGDAVGCARLLIEKHATTEKNGAIKGHQFNNSEQEQIVFHIGRVAVLEEYRQQGVGTQLMQTVINDCLERCPSGPIYLHAQTERIQFYRKLEFVIQGDVFMDAGIPHIEMWYKPENNQ